MEGRLYPLLGTLLLAMFIYLNSFSGNEFRIRVPIPWLQPHLSFVGRVGTRFVDLESGSAIYINGWNSYWLLSSSSPGSVREMLREGAHMGMSVCRTWAFSDGGPNSLQISPGRFDESVFQALDYVIYQARRNRIRLILSLVNNLDQFGGKDQYVKWAQEAGINVKNSTDSFFSDPIIKGFYKNYVKAIVTRRNSFSGISYVDEPAIFAWELMNEPRTELNTSAPVLQAWITEMASYVKSLDRKHLVTIGLEGFYTNNITGRMGVNPGDWASALGSDFIQNSAVKDIDFASVHAYPDTWIPKASLEEKVKYLNNWVDAHVNDSQNVLKKPVIFSEIGSNLEVKNGTYNGDLLLKTVFDKIYKSAEKRQAGAGALIWQLTVQGMQSYNDEFSLIARDQSSTYTLLVRQSCRLNNLFREKVKRRKCSEL